MSDATSNQRDALMLKLGGVLSEIAAFDAGPRRIKRSNQAEINASLKDISEGRAIVVDDAEPVRRVLGANEIAKDNPAGISANLKDIAAGRKIIVDPFLP